MRTHRRFRTGMTGVCLGNGLLALGFVLDGSLVGSAGMIALAGAAVAMAGAAAIRYVIRTNPEEFEFTGSAVKRHAPTVVLVGGFATVFAGASNLALAVLG